MFDKPGSARSDVSLLSTGSATAALPTLRLVVGYPHSMGFRSASGKHQMDPHPATCPQYLATYTGGRTAARTCSPLFDAYSPSPSAARSSTPGNLPSFCRLLYQRGSPESRQPVQQQPTNHTSMQHPHKSARESIGPELIGPRQ